MAKSKAKKKSVLGFVLFGLVAVALVLVIVGMFVGQVNFTYQTMEGLKKVSATDTFKLFDEWGDKKFGSVTVEGVSNIFAVISFIVTLVGLVLLVIDGVLRLFMNKDCKYCRILGAAVTLVGAILILVSGLVMANQCYGGDDAKKLLEAMEASFSAGAGVWLGFVGGLVGAVAGALPISKKFA